MRRTMFLTLLLLLRGTLAVFRVVRAQNPPVLSDHKVLRHPPTPHTESPNRTRRHAKNGTLCMFISDSDNKVVRLLNFFYNGIRWFATLRLAAEPLDT